MMRGSRLLKGKRVLQTAAGAAAILCSASAAQMLGRLPAAAQSQQVVPGPKPPQLMERQKEIALALSACPPRVADKAAVYVLETSGYVKVRDSENGFTAIVQHTVPTSQEPRCMDAEGRPYTAAAGPHNRGASRSGKEP